MKADAERNMSHMLTTLDVSKLRGWLKAAAESNIWFIHTTLDVSRLSGWLKAVAVLNMPAMFVRLDVSRLSGWLKAAFCWNMEAMLVTLDVSRFSGWLKPEKAPNMPHMSETREVSRLSCSLKAYARQNMERMLVTLDVSKVSGWLKAAAELNMLLMSVTLEVSQPEMSALKLALAWKRELMSEIRETSQPSMGPYVASAAVGSVSYAATATNRSDLDMKVYASTVAGRSSAPRIMNSFMVSATRSMKVYSCAPRWHISVGAMRASRCSHMERRRGALWVGRHGRVAGRGAAERRRAAEAGRMLRCVWVRLSTTQVWRRRLMEA